MMTNFDVFLKKYGLHVCSYGLNAYICARNKYSVHPTSSSFTLTATESYVTFALKFITHIYN